MGQRSFNPTRLTLARQRNGFTKQHLADLCGVSRRAVTAWESGDVDNPPLEALVTSLGFPLSFFLSDDPPLISRESIAFRALSTMTARQLDRILATTTFALELSDWINENYKTPRPNLPDFSEPDDLLPAVAAESLRSIWGLHERPVNQLLPLLERNGVRVFSLPIEDREVDAFSFWRDTEPYIFLNTGKTAERIRFDLAHELAHLLMHRQVVGQKSRSLEQDAQTFASNLLIPADALYAQVVGRLRLGDVFKLKRYWRVSAVALVHRLAQLAIISEWHYRTWMIELSQQGFRSSEPGGIHPEASRLFKELLRLLREDGWSTHRIASELNIPAREINGMVFGLAIAPAPANAGTSQQPDLLMDTRKPPFPALSVIK